MTEVALRPATAADEPLMARVYAGTRAEELASVPWPDEAKAAFVAHQFAAQSAHYAQHYPGMTRDVVLIDGRPAGRLLVDRWEREIRIVDISLLPSARGRGAGGILLRRLMEEAAATGKRLSIHVEVHNRAMSLYERLGFRPVGDEGVYLRMEWDPAQVKMAS